MAKDVAGRIFVAFIMWLVLPLASVAQQLPDWQAQMRERLAAKDINAALTLTERRLSQAPQDLEARGWRARLLAWSNRWKEAEAEYRRVLEVAPQDTDILLGLADVLAWQQRFDEAVAVLDLARRFEPSRLDLHTRRGRALRSLKRTEEARAAFREALALDPSNTEAQAGLASLEPQPRHELRFNSETELLNFAEEAQAFSLSLRSWVNSHWTTSFAGAFQERFAEQAGKFTAAVTYHPGRRDAVTVGGSVGRHRGVIPKGETFFEYVHGFQVSSDRFVRGVETGYRQHWLWFRDARILVLTPNVVFYLPRDCNLSVQIMVARSRFPSTAAEWRPSGLTRLSFPVHERVTANVFYALGTENFARVDQLGRFSARTWGAGGRLQLTKRHDVTAYALYQDRSQGRAQTGFGLSYGIRF